MRILLLVFSALLLHLPSFSKDSSITISEIFSKINGWQSAQKYLISESFKIESDAVYLKSIYLKFPDPKLKSVTKNEVSFFGTKVVYYSYRSVDGMFAYFPCRNITCMFIDKDRECRYLEILLKKFSKDGSYDYNKIFDSYDISSANGVVEVKVDWSPRFLMLNSAAFGK